jgi:hypothetical protein
MRVSAFAAAQGSRFRPLHLLHPPAAAALTPHTLRTPHAHSHLPRARCFIGLRRLQRALASCPDVRATLRWVPYVFDPDTPGSPPLTWRAYVALRYPERAEFIYTQKLPYTLAQAASEGIALFDYENRPVCPTVDALCLLKAGADAGRCVCVRVRGRDAPAQRDDARHDALRRVRVACVCCCPRPPCACVVRAARARLWSSC